MLMQVYHGMWHVLLGTTLFARSPLGEATRQAHGGRYCCFAVKSQGLRFVMLLGYKTRRHGYYWSLFHQIIFNPSTSSSNGPERETFEKTHKYMLYAR